MPHSAMILRHDHPFSRLFSVWLLSRRGTYPLQWDVPHLGLINPGKIDQFVVRSTFGCKVLKICMVPTVGICADLQLCIQHSRVVSIPPLLSPGMGFFQGLHFPPHFGDCSQRPFSFCMIENFYLPHPLPRVSHWGLLCTNLPLRHNPILVTQMVLAHSMIPPCQTLCHQCRFPCLGRIYGSTPE